MNGQRKPRHARAKCTTADVSSLVSKLTSGEVNSLMATICKGFKALREGVASEVDWAHVVSAMNMADGFEEVINKSGTRGHIQAAQYALNEVLHRALATGTWCAPTLFLEEIDHVRDGIDFYHRRLLRCTFGEFKRVQTYATAEVESGGGVVLQLIDQATAQQQRLEAT